MRTSSSNFTRSNDSANRDRAASNLDPVPFTKYSEAAAAFATASPPTENRRWQRFMICLSNHPGLSSVLALIVRTAVVLNWIPTGTGSFESTSVTLRKWLATKIVNVVPREVLVESYRRLVRRELIRHLS